MKLILTVRQENPESVPIATCFDKVQSEKENQINPKIIVFYLYKKGSEDSEPFLFEPPIFYRQILLNAVLSFQNL